MVKKLVKNEKGGVISLLTQVELVKSESEEALPLDHSTEFAKIRREGLKPLILAVQDFMTADGFYPIAAVNGVLTTSYTKTYRAKS